MQMLGERALLRHLHEGHSVAETALAQLHDPIRSLHSYNPQLPAVAQEVLAYDPAERYANVEKFILSGWT